MLSFIVVSGMATIIIKSVCNAIAVNNIKKRGYITNHIKPSNIQTIIFNFIPGVNLLVALVEMVITGFILYGNPKQIEKFLLERNLIYNPTDELNHVNRLKNQIDEQSFMDAMTLDGASKEVIDSELKSAKREIYSDYYELSNKKYRELQAMSDTELWLRDIELHNGLSSDERNQLFSSYVKDFQSNKENTKPKAIQKTYKIIANKKTNV